MLPHPVRLTAQTASKRSAVSKPRAHIRSSPARPSRSGQRRSSGSGSGPAVSPRDRLHIDSLRRAGHRPRPRCSTLGAAQKAPVVMATGTTQRRWLAPATFRGHSRAQRP
ncbi:hypothetical protein FJT64_021246 [Amphibalanus amphitrite]|uniref:Uncharacterized protein n=1 Tax=Amphibalanus amphitrite TaxID=1232801 RepID=A0A6A4WY72_AMPAM|nr:hypothetical protein FJT64_021246 [Amphibalanus amphitrite]